MSKTMFDWPEQSQLSPTSTSSIFTDSGPLAGKPAGPSDSVMDMTCGVLLAFIESRTTFHVPSLSAVADLTWPPNSTVTFLPAGAQPHTGTLASLWMTMWALKILGNSTG